jgi:hypothetical protein
MALTSECVKRRKGNYTFYMLGKAQNGRVRPVREIVPRLKILPVAKVVGDNGYLMGWDVVDQNSEKLCSDRYVWVSTKEIECEVEE